jgi:hypothetical protein
VVFVGVLGGRERRVPVTGSWSLLFCRHDRFVLFFSEPISSEKVGRSSLGFRFSQHQRCGTKEEKGKTHGRKEQNTKRTNKSGKTKKRVGSKTGASEQYKRKRNVSACNFLFF